MSRAALLPVAVAVALALLPADVRAQEPAKPASNNLTVYGSIGYVRNVSHFDVPIPGIDQNGLAGGVRVMWQPDHLLSAGLEVGHTSVYSVDQQLPDGSRLTSSLDAWPILFVFSMSPLHRLHVNVGTGPAISTSTAEALGNRASSTAGGSAYMASVLYLAPVGKKFGLGGELRFLRTTKYQDNNLSLQITLAYRFLDW